MQVARSILTAAGLVCTSVCADDHHAWMARLKAADARCEEARTIKLAPIREQLVHECVKEGHRSLSVCQNEMRFYGESYRGPRGAFIKGMFYDLPECVAAEREWDAYRESQRQR